MTKTLSLFAGVFDKLNVVVLPFPVKLSIVLSDTSKVTLLFVKT